MPRTKNWHHSCYPCTRNYDGSVAGSLESLQIVLDNLYEHGDAFVYNLIKCHPITKPEFFSESEQNFLRGQMLMLFKINEFWVQLLILMKNVTVF